MRSDSLFFAHNTVVNKKKTVPDKQLPIEYGFIKVMMKHFKVSVERDFLGTQIEIKNSFR